MDSVDFEVGNSNQQLRFVRKVGPQIADVFDALARLRITVFRDYPYLYDGSVDYEKTYLQTYVNSARAFLFAVYDNDQMIGATTCIPLADETDEVKQPILDAGYALPTVFYFGESLLLPAHRGLGLGHRFFDEREAYAATFGACKFTCFCAVARPDNHPMRPATYQPLDAFWISRGYQKAPQLRSRFDWTDVGESVPTAKPMVYWLRPLPVNATPNDAESGR